MRDTSISGQILEWRQEKSTVDVKLQYVTIGTPTTGTPKDLPAIQLLLGFKFEREPPRNMAKLAITVTINDPSRMSSFDLPSPTKGATGAESLPKWSLQWYYDAMNARGGIKKPEGGYFTARLDQGWRFPIAAVTMSDDEINVIRDEFVPTALTPLRRGNTTNIPLIEFATEIDQFLDFYFNETLAETIKGHKHKPVQTFDEFPDDAELQRLMAEHEGFSTVDLGHYDAIRQDVASDLWMEVQSTFSDIFMKSQSASRSESPSPFASKSHLDGDMPRPGAQREAGPSPASVPV
jgi:hypothetical protein